MALDSTVMEISLYNSTYCRLCCEENSNGILLYDEKNEPDKNLSSIINQYLPMKIEDDGKLPRTICTDCHIQLQSTITFFELIVKGQEKLRDLWKYEVDLKKKIFREFDILEVSESGLGDDPVFDDIQQSFQSLFSEDHPMLLRFKGYEKPRRKRGRPRKDAVKLEDKVVEAGPQTVQDDHVPIEEITPTIQQEDESVLDENGQSKHRRRRKAPERFKEVVQGPELERIYREEGVIDEEEDWTAPEKERKELIGVIKNEDGEKLGGVVAFDKVLTNGITGAVKFARKQTQFECEVCHETFSKQNKFIAHKQTHNQTVVSYKCLECGDEFPNQLELDLHQQLEDHVGSQQIEGCKPLPDVPLSLSKDNSFVCTLCNVSCESKADLDKHKASVHPEEKKSKKFVCPVCGKSFNFNSTYKSHMQTAHKQVKGDMMYPCDICGKLLSHPSSVVYHKESEHNDGRRFDCATCGKSFKHRQLLRRHQLVHSDKRPYFCEVCNASFKTKHSLVNHSALHSGEKKYTCDLCGYSFNHKTSLAVHTRWHTGQKPYECNICKKRWSQKGNLLEHMRTHTGEKPFKCDICSRCFTTYSQHKLHMKRHSGERPWVCEYCNKSFLHRGTWKCHLRRHRGEKPYRCSYCPREFSEMWALTKHLRLHTGEKPYACIVCGKTFADCSNSTKHKRCHSPRAFLEAAAKLKAAGKDQGDDTQEDIPQISLEVPPPVLASFSQLKKDETLPTMVIKSVAFEKDNLSPFVEESEDCKDSGLVPTPNLAQDSTLNWNMLLPPTQSKDPVSNFSDLEPIIHISYADPEDPAGEVCQVKYLIQDAEQTTSDKPVVLPQLQAMQVTDEHGNPIRLTMQDGSQLEVTTADGQSLQVTTKDGQTIPVKLTMDEASPLVQLLFNCNSVASIAIAPPNGNDLASSTLPTLGQMVENSTITDLTELEEDQPAGIEFITDDGQVLALDDVRMLDQLNDPMRIL